jgi:hypothetical protein
MLSYFRGGEEDSEDIVEKRVRVLRLHVETLTRQAEVREAELAAARKSDATLIIGGEDTMTALDSEGALFGLVSPKGA